MGPSTLAIVTDQGSDQMSLFGASLYEPRIDDLEGLLAGPGQAVRRSGAARLSVIVADRWRIDALHTALAEREIPAEDKPADGGTAVRTAFSSRLTPIASRWLRGAVKRPPPGFRLTDNQLRLWTVCAGVADPAGFLLRLSHSDGETWPAIRTALATAGVDADFVGVRAGGPAYRVSSRRRMRLLRALVGEPPPGAKEWPE